MSAILSPTWYKPTPELNNVCDIYCARGNAELYIKDHKLYSESDRTSCCRFAASGMIQDKKSQGELMIFDFVCLVNETN